MPIQYKVGDLTFSLSYKSLREDYKRFVEMDDDEFMENISSALHLGCIIGYLKEIPTYDCLRDDGIIHQLVHLIDMPNEPTVNLKNIRQLFKETLELK